MHHEALDRAADDAGVAVGRRADRVRRARRGRAPPTSPSGITAPSAAPAEQRGVGAQVGRGQPGDLVGHLVDRFQVEVGAEAQGQLDGDPPVLHGGAGRASPCGPGAGGGPRGSSSSPASPRPAPPAGTRGPASVLGVGKASTATTNGTLASARRARSRSGKSDSGSAPSRTSASMRPSAAAAEDPGGVEAPLGGHATPGGLEPGPAGVEGHPPRQEPGRQAEVEPTVDVAAPQRREEPDPGHVAQRRGGRHGGVGRLGQRRPPEDDDDRPLVAGLAPQERGRRPQFGVGSRRSERRRRPARLDRSPERWRPARPAAASVSASGSAGGSAGAEGPAGSVGGADEDSAAGSPTGLGGSRRLGRRRRGLGAAPPPQLELEPAGRGRRGARPIAAASPGRWRSDHIGVAGQARRRRRRSRSGGPSGRRRPA